MTEAEKALAGLLYDANYDPALIAERGEVKYRLQQYNQTDPRDRPDGTNRLRRCLAVPANRF